MKISAYDEDKVELMLSVHELSTIHQCLNEVCHGFVVPDFQRRIGADVAVVSGMLGKLEAALSTASKN